MEVFGFRIRNRLPSSPRGDERIRLAGG